MTPTITEKSTVSLPVIFTVLGMAAGLVAWCYSTVNAALTTQDERIVRVENQEYQTHGQLEEINGKLDVILRQVRKK